MTITRGCLKSTNGKEAEVSRKNWVLNITIVREPEGRSVPYKVNNAINIFWVGHSGYGCYTSQVKY